jgi:hypothetical protein
MAERTCPACGGSFTAVRGRRFCSESCWPSRRPRFAPEPDEVVAAVPGSYDEVIDLLWRAARKGSDAMSRSDIGRLQAATGEGSNAMHFGIEALNNSPIPFC